MTELGYFGIIATAGICSYIYYQSKLINNDDQEKQENHENTPIKKLRKQVEQFNISLITCQKPEYNMFKNFQRQTYTSFINALDYYRKDWLNKTIISEGNLQHSVISAILTSDQILSLKRMYINVLLDSGVNITAGDRLFAILLVYDNITEEFKQKIVYSALAISQLTCSDIKNIILDFIIKLYDVKYNPLICEPLWINGRNNPFNKVCNCKTI